MDCDGCHKPIQGVVHRVGDLTYCNDCNREILAKAVKGARATIVKEGRPARVANDVARQFIKSMQEGE